MLFPLFAVRKSQLQNQRPVTRHLRKCLRPSPELTKTHQFLHQGMKLPNTLSAFGKKTKEIIHPIPNPVSSIMIWLFKEEHTKPHGTWCSTTKSSHIINKQINKANSKQWPTLKILSFYFGIITTCTQINYTRRDRITRGRGVLRADCVSLTWHKSEGSAHRPR